MTTQTPTAVRIPGYIAGTWDLDPVHSEVSFSVRHMMVSKVRGKFTRFTGEIVTAADPLASSGTGTIELASIDTSNNQRDDHIRSADFFDVETHPTMTWRSAGLRQDGDGYVVDGELSLHGVTRPVPLAVELNGFTADPFGGTRLGLSATTEIDRRDFGISIRMPMDGGGVVLGDTVKITIEAEAVLRTA